MITSNQQKAPALLVLIAFAIVYVVWGSTYFFIGMAVHGFPPMLLGAIRYTTAGLLLLAWSAFKGDRIWTKKDIINSGISGLLTLFVATGIVFWVERTMPSAMVAIMVSANPIWFVVLDKGNYRANFKNKYVISGLIIGFAGVILLFSEQLSKVLSGSHNSSNLLGIILLVAGPIAWSAGSLYSKKKGSSGPARLNTAWQMTIAGLAFLPAAAINKEFSSFNIHQVPVSAWMALVYLIIFGSIAAFGAYVWLLQVRPATQVSTHSYVNPVIAVLLGVMFAGEHISGLQIVGLAVILFSVLLINLDKYRKALKEKQQVKPVIKIAELPVKCKVLEAC
ncbi:EamA family transporter [Mucilaginibacter sp. BJC16-A38]|uniref:EamA family transporter n=1 Tax=Mucilaginibacter phenanthrenivorans TaxID=1234842 RepID=UPI002157768D|nr:EamA family transporter [Mucilaginibacter phenanthrenivorans]MCR8559518.1 EamA family transporter [Mucilaginibacter phenanthrenivorans]